MTAVALQTGFVNAKAAMAAFTLSVVIMAHNKVSGSSGQ